MTCNIYQTVKVSACEGIDRYAYIYVYTFEKLFKRSLYKYTYYKPITNNERSFAANAGTVTTLKISAGSWFQMVTT